MIDDELDVLDSEELPEEQDTEGDQNSPPDDSDQDQVDDSGERRLSRKERRAQRGRNLVAESRRAQQDAEQRALDAERRNNELMHRMNEIEQRVGATQKKEEEDDVDRQIMDNYQKRVNLARSFEARRSQDTPVSDAEIEQLMREQKQLDDDQYRLRQQKYAPPPSAPQAGTQESPQVQALRTKYFDVTQNEAASQWAIGRLQSEVAERFARTGARPTQAEGLDLLDDIMDNARDRFSIGKRRAATDSTRRKFAGDSGDYPTSNPRNGSPAQLSATEKNMARVMYDGLDEATAFKKFAKMKAEK